MRGTGYGDVYLIVDPDVRIGVEQAHLCHCWSLFVLAKDMGYFVAHGGHIRTSEAYRF
jgi:hypothetical protein